MNQTTKLSRNGKTYHGGTNHWVPLTVGWRWVDRDIARFVALRPDVDAMPFSGLRVQQDAWWHEADKAQQ
jgi:hypothetical protein